MSARADIAAALSTVDGVTGHAQKPSAATTGDAWSLWSGQRREDGVFETTWRIMVALPADLYAADAWIAERLDDLLDALRPVVYVDRAEPVRIGAGDNAPPALQFTARE